MRTRTSLGPGVGGGPVVARTRWPGEAICQAWLDIVVVSADLGLLNRLDDQWDRDGWMGKRRKLQRHLYTSPQSGAACNMMLMS